jgi:flagellar protein FlbT
MALVIDLKPREKVIIGNAVITNDTQRTRLHIDGDAPILREKDVIKEDEVNTPCKRVYFIIQLMYLAIDPTEHYDDYFKSIREIQEAAPSMALKFADISQHILAGHYYKALKATKKLIKYEKELMENVT